MTLAELRASARLKISKDLTTAGYSDANLDINLNIWYRKIRAWVVEAMGLNEDGGDTYSWTTAVGVGTFAFPATIVALNRVEVLYVTGGDYVPASPMDDRQISDAIQNGAVTGASTGYPVYRIFGNALQIFPVPTAIVTDGVVAEIVDDITALAAVGNVPVVNVLVQDAIAVGAAFEYASSEQMDRLATRLWRQLFGKYDGDPEGLRYQVQMLAESFDRSYAPRFIPKRKSFR
ncbi:MAG: hypothetical protein WC477_07765 [Patescibacteria group bacterium]